ncbi:hypothetical protein [Burkholderia sp. Ax-1724]|uniref:hypothetical protein n=1 Tax=Burkholderia sp. Ax-1724 TaxID=2608336 RepID=UPI0014230617|nr:hypothetical protein [Burkholderia sp. Ax-1724]NIF54514.1 hypothetical protein [Burkholderia sp. Ax-1724]
MRIAEASKSDGVFRMASGAAALPFIARSDLAEAAACALVSMLPGNHAYRLSGPQLLAFDDLAALISTVIGSKVRYESITDGEYRHLLQREGLPPELETRRVAYSQAMRAGFMTALTGDFERLVGRAPLSMDNVLREIPLLP